MSLGEKLINMYKSNDDLIQALAKDHAARPWWQSFHALIALWFSFQVLYFVGLSLLKIDLLDMRSSVLYPAFISAGVLLSGWIFFSLSQGREIKTSSLKLGFVSIVILIMLGLSIEYGMMGTIEHHRALSVTSSDVSCFWHSLASTAGPLLIFPILFRKFFFARVGWAMTFMTLHLALMASLLTELKCPDRELWHLLLGHQTVVLGIGFFMLLLIFGGRNFAFSKTSGPEKWKP